MFPSDMDLPLDHLALGLALGLAIISVILLAKQRREIEHLQQQLRWSDEKIAVLALSVVGEGSVEVIHRQTDGDGTLDIEIRFRPNHTTQGD